MDDDGVEGVLRADARVEKGSVRVDEIEGMYAYADLAQAALLF